MRTSIKELRGNLSEMAETFVQNSIAWREADPKKSYQWFISSEICRKAAEELERMEPVKMELEGCGHFWFLTCSECGMAVAEDSKYCCNCGHPFEEEESGCIGCTNKGGEDCPLSLGCDRDVFCPNGKLR